MEATETLPMIRRSALAGSLICVLLSSSIWADSIGGTWEGMIEIEPESLEVQIQISETASGWSGMLTIPGMDYSGAVSEISVSETAMSFVVPELAGEPSFSVTLEGSGLIGEMQWTPAAPPSTDIYLLRLKPGGWGQEVDSLINITDREGYDNQPYFVEDGSAIIYTSQRGDQTDIYRYDIGSGATSQLTSTSESEYSPTPMPDGSGFSTIQAEADGTQRLWGFPWGGGKPSLLLPDVAPVGYHTWATDDTLALFVLGEHFTLQLASLESGTARVVAEDIGRGMRPMPDGAGVIYIHKGTNDDWRVRVLDLSSEESRDWSETPVGSEDLEWLPDGRLLMAEDSSLLVREESDILWGELVSLLEYNVSGITRVAAASTGTSIAVVGERPASAPPAVETAPMRLTRADS